VLHIPPQRQRRPRWCSTSPASIRCVTATGVSRLLTLLEICQHGYEVHHYISLERLTEESKEDDYEALQRSSKRWQEGKHDLTP